MTSEKMEVKVLGTGCSNCRALEERTRRVLEEAGRDAAVEKVEAMPEIAGYGVMGLPALVVNGDVVLAGRVPGADELAEILGRD